jgi:hypothetical protein
VIGIPETVETFLLEDAIELKRIFLANGEQIHNITYDPMVMTEEVVLARVLAELDRFTLPEQTNNDAEIDENYNKLTTLPRLGEHKLDNESEQAMTALYLDSVKHIWTASTANLYLGHYATNTALDDVIREQNGLTYGVSFYEDIVGYHPFTTFMCDVSRGTEGKLMELFESSINASVDAFTEEAYDKLMKTRHLKRTMRYVNQENYDSLFWTGVWYPYIIAGAAAEFAENVDSSFPLLDNERAQYEQLREYLSDVRDLVNAKEWSRVTN